MTLLQNVFIQPRTSNYSFIQQYFPWSQFYFRYIYENQQLSWLFTVSYFPAETPYHSFCKLCSLNVIPYLTSFFYVKFFLTKNIEYSKVNRYIGSLF